MLLFFSIILFILISILIVLFSDVRLVIDYLKLSNLNHKIIPEYKGAICLYFLGKIKWLNIKINSENNKKTRMEVFLKEKIKNLKKDGKFKDKISKKVEKQIIKQIKEKIKLKSFKLKLHIGTENVILTSYLVGIISSIIPNLIRSNIKKFSYENFKFRILPIYENKNYIYLELSSIISIKLVHIINMFKLMGGKENERSSNRRLNVNCYGKY